ncbi:MAG: IS3 family transposase [Verrucomicrobiales bacterium]|nr:IS3 family transposase [Verrucomicrobiales bacterium]
MSITRQCALLEVPRSSYYHKPLSEPSLEDERIMQAMDRIYMEEPTYGSRRIIDELEKLDYRPSRDRVRRLMRLMGIEPIYPKPRLSTPGKGHKIYPYLLRKLKIERSNQVWCTDITYIPLGDSHVYLCVVMDWSSRYVISWRLSNSLDKAFCIECLEEAIQKEGSPEIFNTDQGSQFTSEAFTDVLTSHGIKISMDGKGRALDNVMIERLWRTVKYDDIYIRGYETMIELYLGLEAFFAKYNKRKHQTLGMSPEQNYRENLMLQNAA